MKTLKNVNKRIDEILKVDTDKIGKSDKGKLKREIKLLKKVEMYLETSPSKTFVKSEIERLKRLVKIRQQGYGNWLDATPGVKELKTLKLNS